MLKTTQNAHSDRMNQLIVKHIYIHFLTKMYNDAGWLLQINITILMISLKWDLLFFLYQTFYFILIVY